jgi:hypothetical protein
VLRRRDVPLHVDAGVVEGRGAAVGAGLGRPHQLGRVVHYLHADPPAAPGGFDKEGVTDPLGLGEDGSFVIDCDRTVRPGRRFGPGPAGDVPRLDLVTEGVEAAVRRAHEDEPRVPNCLGEFLLFAEQAIARMDRLGAALFRGGHDGRHVQIALLHGRRAEAHGLRCSSNVRSVRIGVGKYRHGFDTQAVARPLDAGGYLAAVRDEDSSEHGLRFVNSPARCAGSRCASRAVFYKAPGNFALCFIP